MGFFDSIERRNTSGLANPADWLFDAFGAGRTASGVTVTPESSLEVSSVWAAVRLISSVMATLPLPVYQTTTDGREKARTHPLYKLLSLRPNPEMSSFTWRETMLAHLLLYGASFNEIERSRSGSSLALWPIHPVNISIIRQNGRKAFVVRVDGKEIPLSSEQVLHIPGFSLDGCNGLIPTHLARGTIGHAKAVEDYGSRFFANGASPSGVLNYPGKLSADAAARVRKSFAEAQTGQNAHKPAFLEEGMSWTPLGIPPEHAQFLESRKFSVTEIARVFGIPPHLIGDLERSTFANIEAQGISFVQFCIEPWARRIEQELTHSLLPASSNFVEFDLRGLMRGDSAARAKYYATMVNAGLMTANELRALENLNAMEGGDVLRAPLNMAPIEETKNEQI